MKPILLLLFLALALHATAQTFSGRVTDMSTHKPLAHVIISSWQHNRVAETDSNGNFSFRAGDDKQFYFVLNGYAVTQKPYTPVFAEVAMTPLSVTLNDVTIRPYDAFQSDSAEMARLYGNELSKEAIKPKIYPGAGLVADGVISSVAQHFSKKAKQSKRFKEDFRKDMEQKFVDVRYTPNLVSSLTGLKGESISQFMISYPMDHEFARAASDLEIKAWIRQNYRTYASKMKG
jgi:hypothetical protein